MRPSRCLLLLMLPALAALCGCASTTVVTLDRWHPVDFDVRAVSSLAVLPFEGKDGVAESVRSEVLAELNAREFFTLVPEHIVRDLGQEAAFRGKTEQLHQAVLQARELGIDALLVVRLMGRVEAGSGVGGVVISLGDPRVVVRLSYDLIHVPNGQILAQRSISHHYDGNLEKDANSSTSAEKVAMRLVRECAAEMVDDITVRRETLEIPLAGSSWPVGGAAEVADGNDAAEDGEWQRAVELWKAALNASSDNHAAMYNLGVAFERIGDYGGAAEWYAKAVAENDDTRYRKALDRVDQRREGDHLAQVQFWRQRRAEFVPQYAGYAAEPDLSHRVPERTAAWDQPGVNHGTPRPATHSYPDQGFTRDGTRLR